MNELEVIRLVGEALSIAAFALVGLRWLGGKLLHLLNAVNQTQVSLTDLRGDVSGLRDEFKEMNGTLRKTIERVGMLEGWRDGHKD